MIPPYFNEEPKDKFFKIKRQNGYYVQNDTVTGPSSQLLSISIKNAIRLWALQKFLLRLKPTMKNGDPLLQALFACEARLNAWMNESTLNAELFRRDPMAALRAADLGINESLLLDLEDTVTGLTRKLAG